MASGKVKLNGVATVTTADIIASNGVIHVVDVIGLPDNCNSLQPILILPP
jgi:uncharacterized surface protein with fasciclin (FAS1) repeats